MINGTHRKPVKAPRGFVSSHHPDKYIAFEKEIMKYVAGYSREDNQVKSIQWTSDKEQALLINPRDVLLLGDTICNFEYIEVSE